MQVEYSQLPSFFVDLAQLVDDFQQQNRQLRDQVEAADRSFWHVADAMGGGKAFFSYRDPAVLTKYKEGVKVCQDLRLALGKNAVKKGGRTKSRWGPPRKVGEGEKGGLDMFTWTFRSALIEVILLRAPRPGGPRT